jgi:hypothetical protein
MADQRANRAEFGKKLQGLFFPKDAVDFNLPKKFRPAWNLPQRRKLVARAVFLERYLKLFLT